MKRKGDWIETYTGIEFWPLDPRIEEIEIEDIAHALSNICRFTGHCNQFYSVAEHSVHLSYLMPGVLQIDGLIHDGAEAYLNDISRPLKPYLDNYKSIEDNLLEFIGLKYGSSRSFRDYELSQLIKDADHEMLKFECYHLMSNKLSKHIGRPTENLFDRLDNRLPLWQPLGAKRKFLERFEELKNPKYRLKKVYDEKSGDMFLQQKTKL